MTVSVVPEAVKANPPRLKLRLFVAAKMVAPPSSVLNVAEPAPESTPQENFPVDEFQSKVSDSVSHLDIPVKAEPTKAETEAVPTSSKLLSGKFVPIPIFPLLPLIKNFPSPISRFLLFK